MLWYDSSWGASDSTGKLEYNGGWGQAFEVRKKQFSGSIDFSRGQNKELYIFWLEAAETRIGANPYTKGEVLFVKLSCVLGFCIHFFKFVEEIEIKSSTSGAKWKSVGFWNSESWLSTFERKKGFLQIERGWGATIGSDRSMYIANVSTEWYGCCKANLFSINGASRLMKNAVMPLSCICVWWRTEVGNILLWAGSSENEKWERQNEHCSGY